ncbi:hypothetical protein [Bradyrhizobium sp. USDA 4452]
MAMPLLRYFLTVGVVLFALMFIADAYLPKPPATETSHADLPVIHIYSERKWPDRVVFNTNAPIIVAAQLANESR